MSTEKEKMLSGARYTPADPELRAMSTLAHRRCQEYNRYDAAEYEAKASLLKQLIPHQGKDLYIEAPFFCDYGVNIAIGDHVFFNFNCTILDTMRVTIGHHCMFGPGVQIYTPLHPMKAAERNTGLEYAQEVTIGDNVWVGGNVTILPGVHIGNNCVIGAGSVVTKDVPPDSFAAGNPARVIRTIQQ
ncbi:sugar O-acetyltransferase [Niabella drilacis]|uniref:Acetyltransferase n=1 Tax=Niabella drilacis (strain DSM 25811 / CCM 8410 / CCUG 62505 / LMG 26954 / E90) TaxID=1285928 RepID=A0A1G7B831_NIADE|nr:sugar O-acetyltransferase [Niabella drilacis]SDE22415.1 maltose O-acetyltransferase [Niabella drilacis]